MIIQKIKRFIRIILDTPKKREYMDEMGCYRAVAGNWCNSHGFILFSAKEYRNMTLEELKSHHI